MELGIIGLGRMGSNMAIRLERGGHRVVAYSLNCAEVAAAVENGMTGADSIEEVARKLTPPRAVWSMVPAGSATDNVVDALTNVSFARFRQQWDISGDITPQNMYKNT